LNGPTRLVVSASSFNAEEEGRVSVDQDHRTDWEPMRLREVGDIEDLVLNENGNGKSQTAADSGDIFKPPGQG
jgi:hypothetical protein